MLARLFRGRARQPPRQFRSFSESHALRDLSDVVRHCGGDLERGDGCTLDPAVHSGAPAGLRTLDFCSCLIGAVFVCDEKAVPLPFLSHRGWQRTVRTVDLLLRQHQV